MIMGYRERLGYSTPWPDLAVINDLKERFFVGQGSPVWWSVDNVPDPREPMSFREFTQRLVYAGKRYVTGKRLRNLGEHYEKDAYLYPFPVVPMSILNLKVDGTDLPFVVTARPYNKSEATCPPYQRILDKYPSVPEYLASAGEKEKLLDHFYPHIRGLFAGSRGEHFFWYRIRGEFGDLVEQALERDGMNFIHVYLAGFGWGTRHYEDNWSEFKEASGRVDMRKLKWPDFEAKSVSAEEFITSWENPDEDLIVHYPISIPGTETLSSLVISNRTNNGNKTVRPAVLGIYVRNGLTGRTARHGIARVKDLGLARYISKTISDDFGISVDCVLFTPQKGSPKYERVSSE